MPSPIAIILGAAAGRGTGAANARLLAKKGYHVALVARNASLASLASEIQQDGGSASAHPIESYSYSDVSSVFDTLPEGPLRVALYNGGSGVFKGFLGTTPEDLHQVTESTINAPFAFARAAILRFKANELDDRGNRGTLIFTGATSSLRGNTFTSAFSAGKHATRALSQSLAKEFGKDSIHVAHAIIDGRILTDRARSENDADPGTMLDPADIAEVCLSANFHPKSMLNVSQNYWHLINQARSAWTWELDCMCVVALSSVVANLCCSAPRSRKVVSKQVELCKCITLAVSTKMKIIIQRPWADIQ